MPRDDVEEADHESLCLFSQETSCVCVCVCVTVSTKLLWEYTVKKKTVYYQC